jgi:hypothetical protein
MFDVQLDRVGIGDTLCQVFVTAKEGNDLIQVPQYLKDLNRETIVTQVDELDI